MKTRHHLSEIAAMKPAMKPSIHTTLPLIALTLAPLNATPISIVNPSFETPDLVTDTAAAVSGATWRRVGNGSNPLGLDSAGLAKRVGAGTFATILDPTPDTLDAEQALYLNGSTESVFQVLSATLEANTTYTLTVDAGDRTGLDFQACEIRLGTVICSREPWSATPPRSTGTGRTMAGRPGSPPSPPDPRQPGLATR
jgi:hypothetical protein